MFTYFFVIFEMDYMIFRYKICLEEYMDLSLRLKTDTKFEDIEPMERTKIGSKKKI